MLRKFSLLKSAVVDSSALQLTKAIEFNSKPLLENVALGHDLQACVALYELGRLSLKIERDWEWYKIDYEKALEYADQAVGKAIFFGNILKSIICAEILGKIRWIPSSNEEQCLKDKIYNRCYPEILASLFIQNELFQSKKIDLSKYKTVPNFIHFEHPDRGPLPSKEDIAYAISSYSEESNLSPEKIKDIKCDAIQTVGSLGIKPQSRKFGKS